MAPANMLTGRQRDLGPPDLIRAGIQTDCWQCKGTGQKEIEIHTIVRNIPTGDYGPCDNCGAVGKINLQLDSTHLTAAWRPFMPRTREPFLPQIPGFILLGVGDFRCPNDVEGEKRFRVPVYRCEAFMQVLVEAGIAEKDPEPGMWPETEFVLLPPPGTDGRFKFGTGIELFEFQVEALNSILATRVHDEVTVPAGTDPAVQNALVAHQYAEMRRIEAPFLIARTAMTERVWLALNVGATPHSNIQDHALPVRNVSWIDCTDLCERYGFRLPTEREWEYACRAGTTTAFCFGDDHQQFLKEWAWYRRNAESVMPVAQKRPNAFGLFDMHGNVEEWCFDRWGDPNLYEHHVLRGGSYSCLPPMCTSYTQEHDSASINDQNIGFRLALSIS